MQTQSWELSEAVFWEAYDDSVMEALRFMAIFYSIIFQIYRILSKENKNRTIFQSVGRV